MSKKNRKERKVNTANSMSAVADLDPQVAADETTSVGMVDGVDDLQFQEEPPDNDDSAQASPTASAPAEDVAATSAEDLSELAIDGPPDVAPLVVPILDEVVKAVGEACAEAIDAAGDEPAVEPAVEVADNPPVNPGPDPSPADTVVVSSALKLIEELRTQIAALQSLKASKRVASGSKARVNVVYTLLSKPPSWHSTPQVAQLQQVLFDPAFVAAHVQPDGSIKVSEPELFAHVEAAHAAGMLRTRQHPVRIFQYYRSDLLNSNCLRWA